jgi:peroxiredoxin
MNDRTTSHLLAAVLLLAAGPVPGDEGLGPPPDLSAAIGDYQAEASAGDSPLTAEDLSVMAESKAALAREMPDPGLAVGERAPDFTLPNAFGEPVRLYAALEQGPVVLTFYRGAWCPYCNLELRALKRSLGHFERHGAQLVAVTPQQPDRSRAQVEQDGYPFQILSDLDSRVMRDYRLFFEVPQALRTVYRDRLGLDIAAYNGPGRWVLPVPGTFVIDRDGIVRAAFADVDYTRRMQPADIVAALEALEAAP